MARYRRRELGALVALVVLASACGSKANKPATPTTSIGAPTTASTPTTSSPPTTSPTTTTTAPAPSSRRLYPAYLPSGVGPARLWVYPTPNLDSGYTQSYYGAPNATGKPAELAIEERPARMGGGPGATTPATFAGRNVLLWRDPNAENPVIVVTAKLHGRDVTLVSYALSDRDLGAVLDGLQPRTNGSGWDTTVLPAGLRLFGEGDQTPEPSDVYYMLKFGSSEGSGVSVSVHPGALLPEDTCICNPGGRRSLKTTTINGKPAVVIDRSDVEGVPGADFEVDWQYAPDIVAGVSVYRFDENQAIRIASSLTRADPATWAALHCVNSTGATIACSPDQEVPASG